MTTKTRTRRARQTESTRRRASSRTMLNPSPNPFTPEDCEPPSCRKRSNIRRLRPRQADDSLAPWGFPGRRRREANLSVAGRDGTRVGGGGRRLMGLVRRVHRSLIERRKVLLFCHISKYR